MLIELIRNKNTFAFDYYKEIISNYRKIANEIDMSLLADDKRRATIDIDIDLIRYSLEDKSILLLFDKLNQIDDGIKI